MHNLMRYQLMWTTQLMPNMTGKTSIVTGANSGIGYETAKALYHAGAHVILACRSEQKANQTRQRLLDPSALGGLETGVLELADLASVTQFAATVHQHHSQLHILINNAGVATPPAAKTAQGYELQFGVNFLGHFALTGCLYPLLKTAPQARIVTLTSNGYQQTQIDFANLQLQKDYDALREYRISKLANLLFSLELQRRIVARGDSVQSMAAQPGANNTGLTRHLRPEVVAAGKARIGDFMEPWQGALSTLYAATSPDAVGGKMYAPEDRGYLGYPIETTIEFNALDEPVARQLWQLGQQATGIQFPD